MFGLHKNFGVCTRGNFAVMSAVLAVPLLFALGSATDYTLLHQQKSGLQEATDSAALATNKEAGLASISDVEIQAIAEDYVFAGMGISVGSKAASNMTITTAISADQADISVYVSYHWAPFILHHLSAAVQPIKVSATATRSGSENLCVIALDASQSGTIRSVANSEVMARDCAIYSNSVSSTGIDIGRRGIILSSTTYSSGGYTGSASSFNPIPVTDTPPIADPLINRAKPDTLGCKETNLAILSGTRTLDPGVYCGGLMIDDAQVKLRPGIYVFKDGPLLVSGVATLSGENVGFYFEGDASVMELGPPTTISLTAPKIGIMAGILIFEDRDAAPNREFVIRSMNAEKLEGTIYLPNSTLLVELESRIGQASKWTAIVANKLLVRNGPRIEINSDYRTSEIPVPDGVGSNGGTVRLTK